MRYLEADAHMKVLCAGIVAHDIAYSGCISVYQEDDTKHQAFRPKTLYVPIVGRDLIAFGVSPILGKLMCLTLPRFGRSARGLACTGYV